MKPIIALVGRPNVGKSTLFNRLTKSRDAIVADFAGLTRDRHYGQGRQGKHEYIVIDTGGFEPEATGGIFHEMAKQTRQAVAEADVVIFVVDVRAGLSAQDHDIASYLRRLGKPCVLVANKAEGMQSGIQLSEFYELGLGEVYPVSAAHGQGIRGLVETALEPLNLPEPEEDEALADGLGPIKLAVAGRPNVGKSTLINTWLGEERLVAFDMPGTTRDAISVPFERQGQKFELIDTAGLRRKGRVFEAIEKFSVVKTLQAIESANVVLLLIDMLRRIRRGAGEECRLPLLAVADEGERAGGQVVVRQRGEGDAAHATDLSGAAEHMFTVASVGVDDKGGGRRVSSAPRLRETPAPAPETCPAPAPLGPCGGRW